MNRLREKYENWVKAELSNKFNYTSSMQITKIEKIKKQQEERMIMLKE